jgi:hypothetical protein
MTNWFEVRAGAMRFPGYRTCSTRKEPGGSARRRSASLPVCSSHADQSECFSTTICRSWIGATSGLGSVVSSVKASPPAAMGRHRPAKQNQSSSAFVNFHFVFGDFVPGIQRNAMLVPDIDRPGTVDPRNGNL